MPTLTTISWWACFARLASSRSTDPKERLSTCAISRRFGWGIVSVGARDTLQITPKLFTPREPENDPDNHAYVVQKFLRLHDRPDGWRYVNALVRGIVAYLAPTLPHVRPRGVYEQIAAAAREAAFDEICSFGEVHDFWNSAHARWLKRVETSN